MTRNTFGYRAKLRTTGSCLPCTRFIRAPASSTLTPQPKLAWYLWLTIEKPDFPSLGSNGNGAVQMKIVDGALHVRSGRSAAGFLGEGAPALTDNEGFVETGDMVQMRGSRYCFVGRRGGIINVGGAKVHPEEVETALNGHAIVRASSCIRADKSNYWRSRLCRRRSPRRMLA